jgi:hypothetical protein
MRRDGLCAALAFDLVAEHAGAAADDARRACKRCATPAGPVQIGSGEDRFNGVCLAALAGDVSRA